MIIMFELKKLVSQKVTIALSTLLFAILLLFNFLFSYVLWTPSDIIEFSYVKNHYNEIMSNYMNYLDEGEDEGMIQYYGQWIATIDNYGELGDYVRQLQMDDQNEISSKYYEYIIEHKLTSADFANYFNNRGYLSTGVQSVINSMYYSSFFVIPIFIVIFCYLSFRLDDQLLYLLPENKYKVILSKIIATIIYTFLTIVIGFFIVFLFYGLKNGFGSLKVPICLSLNEKISSSKYADFNLISYGQFILLCFLIMLLYIVFIVLLTYGAKALIQSSKMVLVIMIALVVGYYYLVFHKFEFWDTNYLIPFTYSNPVFALFGKTQMYDIAKAYWQYDYDLGYQKLFLGSQISWKYGFPADVYYGSALKVLGISDILVVVINAFLYRKREIRK